jgi:hypothetical protein
MLSVDEVRKYVKDKKDLYHLAQRNGFYMPSFKSGCCSEIFIMNVLKGKWWCPKVDELRLKPCLQPPSVDILISKVLSAAKAAKKEIGINNEKLRPNTKWLVDVLALLRPDDEVFKKDYAPTPSRERIVDVKTIELPIDLFTGMPVSKSKSKQCRLKLMGRESKIQRLKRQ